MTYEELVVFLRPHLEKVHPEGVFDNGEFDLDITIGDWSRYTLWLDGNTPLIIPHHSKAEDIQKAVRSFGREVIHTWSQQYSTDPEKRSL